MSTARVKIDDAVTEAMSEAWTLCCGRHYIAAAATARTLLEGTLRKVLRQPWTPADRSGVAHLFRDAQKRGLIASSTKRHGCRAASTLSEIVHGRVVGKPETEEALEETGRMLQRLMSDLTS